MNALRDDVTSYGQRSDKGYYQYHNWAQLMRQYPNNVFGMNDWQYSRTYFEKSSFAWVVTAVNNQQAMTTFTGTMILPEILAS